MLAVMVASAVTVPSGLALAKDHDHDRHERRGRHVEEQRERYEHEREARERFERERFEHLQRERRDEARRIEDIREHRESRRYDPALYYRNDGGRYRERRLGANDRIYRGYDDRYYCEHGDGTTGLIVGGIAGGVLGNVIAPGDSKTLGTILGAGGGALLGRAIDRNHVSCR